ncbi:hypothetical protein OVV29_34765 [Klebsiella pneumoniae]|nr:hypothetical protein [Klebsiella pneumoniae]
MSEMERLQTLILEKYSVNLFKDLEGLIEFHKLLKDLDIVSNRIGTYINNSKNTDLTEPK